MDLRDEILERGVLSQGHSEETLVIGLYLIRMSAQQSREFNMSQLQLGCVSYEC